MLYTRCPQCGTTFRITENALTQAGGQVRCGRCSHIFDARESLSDRLSEEPAPAAPGTDSGGDGDDRPASEAATAAIEAPAARAPDEAAADRPEAQSPAEAALDADTREQQERTDEPEPTDEPEATDEPGVTDAPQPAETPAPDAGDDAGRASHSDTDAGQIEPVPDETDAPVTPARDVMTADEIDAVLDALPQAAGPDWIPDDAPRRRSPLWAVAAAIALLAFAAQAIHYFRGDLARNETVGPIVESAYALLGQPVVPDWDLGNYELLDWVAVEDPSGEAGQRNLIIRSRLRNNGAQPQPYPLVYLRLLDRWEDAVGARLFEPGEYGPRESAPTGMMHPGEVVATELVIVDPGADAYGFELAVCLTAQTGVVCDNDATFR